jgi:hypothetical protein
MTGPDGALELSTTGGSSLHVGSPNALTPGQTYDFGAPQSGWAMSIYATGDPVAPTVSTVAATAILSTSAMLNGSIINDGGEACQYRFRYRTQSDPYQYTTWAGSKSSGEAFSEALTGLTAGVLYQFNAQAKSNYGGSAWGSELTFTTLKSSSGGSYNQLKNIIESNRKEAELEAKRPITSCPVCDYVPLRVNSRGEKLCPVCGWQSY